MMSSRAWRGVWSVLGGALRACATEAGEQARIGWLGLMAVAFAAAGVGAQPVWEEVLTGASPRYFHAMAYDAARGEVVLFGGWNGFYESGDTWLWGRGADPCPADVNGDGVVNTQDFLAYLDLWASGDTAADWNEDGTIDTRDFLAYLGDWSDRC